MNPVSLIRPQRVKWSEDRKKSGDFCCCHVARIHGLEMAIQSSAPDRTLNVDKAIRMSGQRQMT